MNKPTTPAIVCIVALLPIISSLTLDLSDFLSGFLHGLGIVFELVAIFVLAKTIKTQHENDKKGQ